MYDVPKETQKHRAGTMSTSTRVEIAVIGGGAKAAALAAKAFALRRARIADVHVTVFEQSEIGAHWNGKRGYTDGKQRLCTPAERDVGFPYSSMYGEQVDAELYAQFSWASYLLSTPQGYSRWVDAGRQAPTHQDFADYLRWTVKRSGAAKVVTRVEGLRPSGAKWRIQHRTASRSLGLASSTDFDGVVVSGPGPARRVPLSGATNRVFDGADFWQSLKDVAKVLRKTDVAAQIAIVGAGGSAAAVLAWLTRNGYKDHEIVMVADQAALFTRGDSVFENRLFSDEAAWQALSKKSRQDFFNRLNRGVVWGTVMDQVSSASRLVFLDGRAKSVKADSTGSVDVEVERGDGATVTLRPGLVVDASGFEPWWFLELIRALPVKDRRSPAFQQGLQDGMGPGLDFQGPAWPFPRLHAPFVSSAIGPGFGTLMSLGGMSDRILRGYHA